MTSQARIALWVIAGFAGLWVVALLVWWLVPPPAPTPQSLARKARAQQAQVAQQTKANEAKRALIANGVFTRIDCQSHEVQADGGAWRLTTVDVKRQSVETLSRICDIETDFKRITVIDNRSGRKLAEYSGYSNIELF